jgi:hypothetical protein
MASPSISIPTIDPKIVQKLQQVVTSIDTATGKFNTGSSGIATTKTSVHNAVESMVSQSSGQMVTALSTNIWPATSKDGGKAHDALTSLVPHLTTLKGTINDNLPAIQTGLAAIQTAQADQSNNPTAMTQSTANSLQGQINGLITAMATIAAAAGSANSGVGGISIGGACATGIQPGGKLPNFNNTTYMAMSGDGEQLELFSIEGEGAPVEGAGGDGAGAGKGPSLPAKLLVKFTGPGMKALANLIEKLPPGGQKALATLIGGAGNAFPAAMTSGLTSGSTLSTFLTASLGSLTGSYVVEALVSLGITNSAATISTLTLAGGIGMGSLTVYVIKPLILDKLFPAPKTPPPTVIIKKDHQTGETITTIVQSNGSTETIDVKPNGSEVITQKNADGKTTVKTVPAK